MDFFVYASTLHMVKDPLPLLKNCLPVLKPHGLLVVIERDRDKLSSRDKRFEGLPAQDYYLDLLNEAGFEKVKEFTFLPNHFFWLLRAKGHVSH